MLVMVVLRYALGRGRGAKGSSEQLLGEVQGPSMSIVRKSGLQFWLLRQLLHSNYTSKKADFNFLKSFAMTRVFFLMVIICLLVLRLKNNSVMWKVTLLVA